MLLFWWDEHNQDVCPLPARALPRDSLADSNTSCMAQGDTRHKGAGEPVLTTATVDGRGLELALGERENRTHHFIASVGHFYRNISPALTLK